MASGTPQDEKVPAFQSTTEYLAKAENPTMEGLQALEAKIRGTQPAQPIESYGSVADYLRQDPNATLEGINAIQDRIEQESVDRFRTAAAAQDQRNANSTVKDHELGTLDGFLNQTGEVATTEMARVLGTLGAAPFTGAGADSYRHLDNTARDILNRETILGSLNAAKTEAGAALLAGKLTEADYQARINDLDNSIREVTPISEQELEYVKRKPGSQEYRTQSIGPMGAISIRPVSDEVQRTYRELYNDAMTNFDIANFVNETIKESEFLLGKKKTNPLTRQIQSEQFAAVSAPEEESFKAGMAKFHEGERVEGLSQALGAVVRTLPDAIGVAADNPMATWEYVTEAMVQSSAAGVPGGLLLTNAAYGANVYREGIEHYRKQNNGAAPSVEDEAQIAGAAFAAAAAEQLGEVVVLKGLPLGKVSDKVKDTLNSIESAATRRLTKAAVGTTAAAGRSAQGILGEGVTEGVQTALEEDVSKLRDVQSFNEIIQGTVIGAAAGGSLSTTIEGTQLAGKAVKAGSDAVQRSADAAAKEQAERDAKVKVYSDAADTGDFSNIDVTAEDYDSVMHATAMAKRALYKKPEGEQAEDAPAPVEEATQAEKEELFKSTGEIVKQEFQKLNEAQEALSAAKEDDTTTRGQLKELERAVTVQQERFKGAAEAAKGIQASFQQKAADTDAVVEETVQAEERTAEVDEGIVRTFGSMRHNPESVTVEQAEKLLNSNVLSPNESRELQDHVKVEQAVNKLVKSSGEVQSDILVGTPDRSFVGLRQYIGDARTAVLNGDTDAYIKAKTALDKFSGHLQTKLDVLTRVADAMRAKQPIQAEDQAYLDKNEWSFRTPRGAEVLRDTVLQEVAALNAGQQQVANMPTVLTGTRASTRAAAETEAVLDTVAPAQPESVAQPVPEVATAPAPQPTPTAEPSAAPQGAAVASAEAEAQATPAVEPKEPSTNVDPNSDPLYRAVDVKTVANAAPRVVNGEEAYTETNARDVTRSIAGDTKNSRYVRKLAQRLYQLTQQHNIPMTFWPNQNGATRGNYKLNQNKISIYPNGSRVSTILHEIIHGVTAKVITNPETDMQQKLVAELARVRDYFLEQVKDGNHNQRVQHVLSVIAKDNKLAEVPTYLLTEPELVQLAQTIPYKGSTVYARVRELVRRLLGISGELDSVFTAVLELTDRIATEQANANQDTDSRVETTAQRDSENSVAEAPTETAIAADTSLDASEAVSSSLETVAQQEHARISEQAASEKVLDGKTGQAHAKAYLRNTNWIGRFFKPGKKRTLIQTIQNLPTALINAVNNNDYSLLATKQGEDLTSEQTHLVHNLMMFAGKFVRQMNGTKWDKNPAFRYNNPITYLLNEQGKFHPNIAMAISAAAYNWAGTAGRETLVNTDDDIRSILDLNDDRRVTKSMRDDFSFVGSNRNLLASQLGQEIFAALDLKLVDDASNSMKANFITSLGATALETMLEMKLVQEHRIKPEVFRRYNDNFRATEDVVFFSLAHDGQGNAIEQLEAMSDALRAPTAKGKLDAWFGTETSLKGPSFSKPRAGRPRKMQNTDQDVPQKAAAKLDKYEATEYGVDHSIHSLFEGFTEEQQLELMGGTLDVEGTVHVSRRKSVAAKTRALKRELDHYMDFIRSMETPDAGFFFRSVFWKQMRMGMDSNTVNPQSSKAHRHFMKPKAFTATINVENVRHRKAFLAAAAEAMGIAIDKPNEASGIEALESKLTSDLTIIAGITAIQKQQRGEELTGSEQQDIIDAVKAGGENIASLDALVNLAKYMTAWEQPNGKRSFENTLPREVDGATNGVIIGFTQYNTSPNWRNTAAKLMKGGFFFSNAITSLAEWRNNPLNGKQENLDSYKEIVPLWNDALAGMPKSADYQAITRLMGDLFDKDGKVSKAARNLAKIPLMTTVYGASAKAVATAVADNFVEDLYKRIESSSQKALDSLPGTEARIKATDDLILVQKALRDIFGRGYTGDLTADFEANLELTLDPAQERYLAEMVADNHATLLVEAVEKVYANFIQTRRITNSALQMMFQMYNIQRNHLIEQRKQALAEAADSTFDPKTMDLPVNEVKKIDEKILNTMPAIRSFFADPRNVKEMVLLAKSQSDTADVSDRVHTLELPGNKKYRSRTRNLKDPGVGPAITAIHSMDAAVILNVMEQMEMLNVHDAGYFNVLEAEAGAQALNQSFYETMRDYSILGETHKALFRSRAAFANFFENQKKKGTPVDPKVMGELQGALAKATQTMDNPPTTMRGLVQMVERAAKAADANRKAILENTLYLDQYSKEGGSFATGNHGSTDLAAELGVSEDQLGQALGEQLAEAFLSAKNSEADNLTHAIEEQEFGSSGTTGIDPNNFHAQKVETITQADVVQTFNMLDTVGTVKENTAHQETLLDLLQRLQSKLIRPFQLHSKTDAFTETVGMISGDDMYLVHQQQGSVPRSGMLANGLRMSSQETFMHELVHRVLHHGLDKHNEATRELKRLYKLARKTLKPTDLLPDPNDTSNLDDLVAAQRRYDHIFLIRRDGTKETFDPSTGARVQHNTSNYLHEFAAFAATNENFRKALERIELKEGQSLVGKLRGKNIQEQIMLLIDFLMDFLGSVYTGNYRAKNAKQAVDRLINDIAGIQGRSKYSILAVADLATNTMSKALSYPVMGIRNVAVKAANSQRARNSRNSAVHLAGGVIRLAHNHSPAALQHAFQQMRRSAHNTRFGFFNKVANEMKGRNQSNKWAHDLNRLSNRMVDQQRQEANSITQQAVRESFLSEVDKAGWDALTKVILKTDITSLSQHYSMEELIGLVEQRTRRSAEITRIERELRTLAASTDQYHFYSRAAEALGLYMAKERVEEPHLLMNAHNIARMYGSGKAIPANVAQIEALVDQLVSLRALSLTEPTHLGAVATIMRNEFAANADTNGITMLLAMHRALQDEALNVSFRGNKVQMQKGYTRDVLDPHVGLKIGTELEGAQWELEGYVKQDDPLEQDPHDPEYGTQKFFYILRGGGMAGYTAQTMSLTSKQARGTKVKTTRADKARFDQEKKQAIASMFGPRANSRRTPKYTAPILDDRGNVTAYRYLMNSRTKDDLLNRLNSADEVLGAMAGSMVDKESSVEMNQLLVNALYDQYQADLGTPKAGEYVTVGPNSADPVAREIYYMMPEDTRAEVQRVWGNRNMMVRKDLVESLFGYRKYSIRELFLKNERDRNLLEKAIHRVARFTGIKVSTLVTLESITMAIVREGKDIIVVKSGVVTLGNFLSNLVYLRTKGVPLSSAIQDTWTAMTATVKYQKDHRELENLKLKVDLGQDRAKHHEWKQRIAELENELATNPVSELVDAGVMQSIVEDVDLDAEKFSWKSTLARRTEQYTNAIPGPVKEVAKFMYMTRDTKLYKVLNNAVRLSDFTARYALYQHELKKGTDKGEAIGRVVDEFVNFDIPTERHIQYFNDMGFLWFSKYAMRIQRVIMKIWWENPVETMQVLLMQMFFGGVSDITDSLWFLNRNPLTILGNPLESVGALDELLTVQPIMP